MVSGLMWFGNGVASQDSRIAFRYGVNTQDFGASTVPITATTTAKRLMVKLRSRRSVSVWPRKRWLIASLKASGFFLATPRKGREGGGCASKRAQHRGLTIRCRDTPCQFATFAKKHNSQLCARLSALEDKTSNQSEDNKSTGVREEGQQEKISIPLRRPSQHSDTFRLARCSSMCRCLFHVVVSVVDAHSGVSRAGRVLPLYRFLL